MKDTGITIGIEVHIQLNTAAKLFSDCVNDVEQKNDPNSNVDFFSTGQIGSYPILNVECVKKAVLFGLATEGIIQRTSSFCRKCYFYHDNPKNYQITQEKAPIVTEGHVKILQKDKSIKNICLERVQLEEDTATTKNYGKFSGINANRAGSPLIEVVTTPSMTTISDAVKFCKEIRKLAIDNNISNGSLEKGNIRFDCNISKDNEDGSLGTRYEIKNLNSFLNIEKALKKAASQQAKLKKEGVTIQETTFRWDAEKNVLLGMREKSTNSYGFMQEVDIPCIVIEESFIKPIQAMVADNPCERVLRFMNTLNVGEDEARTASDDIKLSQYLESIIERNISPKHAFSWVCVEAKGIFQKSFSSHFNIYEYIDSSNIVELVSLVTSNKITRSTGKQLLSKMINKEIKSIHECADILIEEDIDIISFVNDIMQNDKDKTLPNKLSSGDQKVIKYIIGQAMRLSKGKIDPNKIKTYLESFK